MKNVNLKTKSAIKKGDLAMNATVIDSPLNEQAQTWWFLDLLIVEHRCAPDMKTVVLEMTLPVGSSPPLH